MLCSFFFPCGVQDEAQTSQSDGTGADLYCSEIPSRNFSTLDSESRCFFFFFFNDYTVITCFLESKITCIIL